MHRNLNDINEKDYSFKNQDRNQTKWNKSTSCFSKECNSVDDQPFDPILTEHKGQSIFDAMACLQDIAFPNDLAMLNDDREKLEVLIDIVYNPVLYSGNPRKYIEVARKNYLYISQKKKLGHRLIR